MKQLMTKLAQWINERIVGNEFTYLVAILSVLGVYSVLFWQSYQQWNTSTGLFFNTLSSSFELITGVGAVVGVVSLHKKHDATKKSLDALHEKLDKANSKASKPRR